MTSKPASAKRRAMSSMCSTGPKASWITMIPGRGAIPEPERAT